MLPELPDLSTLQTLSVWALRQVWGDRGEHLPADCSAHAETVAQILRTNLSNGRWEHVKRKGNGDEVNLQAYCLRLATHYWAEHKRVASLNDGDGEAWARLRQQLVRRAHHILCTRTELTPVTALEQAHDHAQEACERILRARYPYDVPFDAWATRVLVNCVLRQLTRSPDLLDRGDFVQPGGDDDDPADHGSRKLPCLQRDGLEAVDDQLLLAETIDLLPSEAQRRAIRLSYLHGWDDARIAEELGRTPQAVHNLKHRAVHNLKKIAHRYRASD